MRPSLRMRLVVIESPFAGEVEANVAYAKRCVLDCLARGESPYASHLFFTLPGLLDDLDPAQRALGIDAGLAWGRAAQLRVVYLDRGVSSGMRLGVAAALAARQPVELRSLERDILPGDHLEVFGIAADLSRQVRHRREQRPR